MLPVSIISDTATIVALASKVSDGIKWDVLILINEHLELPHTDTQVRVIEAIWDVPAQRPKLPPLLHQCMEEAEREEQLFPSLQ